MENSTLVIILLFILIIHLSTIFYFYTLNKQYHFTTMWLYARCDAIGSEQWHKIKAILENKDIPDKLRLLRYIEIVSVYSGNLAQFRSQIFWPYCENIFCYVCYQ